MNIGLMLGSLGGLAGGLFLVGSTVVAQVGPVPPAGAPVAQASPSAQAVGPRIDLVYFSLDPDGLHPITTISSGSQFYTRYRYSDFTPFSALKHYALINGMEDRVIVNDPLINGPFTPATPSGWITKDNFVTYETGGGIYTVVIELNGKAIARKDIPIY